VKLVSDGEAVRFSVHAKPRAKKTGIRGERGEALEIAVAAPPVEGAANDELVRTLAEALAVPRRDVRIVRGEGSRSKVVEVRGLGVDEVRARLARATVDRG
jgi:uncharacterized protein (TIGR00251 family)